MQRWDQAKLFKNKRIKKKTVPLLFPQSTSSVKNGCNYRKISLQLLFHIRMCCRNSMDVFDQESDPSMGVTFKRKAIQPLQTQDCSSVSLLRNTFPESKSSQSCVCLPQECLLSCSRHLSLPSFKWQRGNQILMLRRMSWLSPNHIHCLLWFWSSGCDFWNYSVLYPQERRWREESLCRLDTEPFTF